MVVIVVSPTQIDCRIIIIPLTIDASQVDCWPLLLIYTTILFCSYCLCCCSRESKQILFVPTRLLGWVDDHRMVDCWVLVLAGVSFFFISWHCLSHCSEVTLFYRWCSLVLPHLSRLLHRCGLSLVSSFLLVLSSSPSSVECCSCTAVLSCSRHIRANIPLSMSQHCQRKWVSKR